MQARPGLLDLHTDILRTIVACLPPEKSLGCQMVVSKAWAEVLRSTPGFQHNLAIARAQSEEERNRLGLGLEMERRRLAEEHRALALARSRVMARRREEERRATSTGVVGMGLCSQTAHDDELVARAQRERRWEMESVQREMERWRHLQELFI